jgi:hypothetical protein
MLTRDNLHQYQKLIGLRAFIYFALQADIEDGLIKQHHTFTEENARAFLDRWGLDIKYCKFRDALISLGDNGYITHAVQMTLELDLDQ